MKRKSITVTFFDNQGNVIKQLQRGNWREEMRKKQQQMKMYKLIFLTKEGAELQTKVMPANNLKEAKMIAKLVLANSMINDLHKIEVKTINN